MFCDKKETFEMMVEEYLADRPELTEGDSPLTVIEYYQDEDSGDWRALAEDEKTTYELRAVGDEIILEYLGTK